MAEFYTYKQSNTLRQSNKMVSELIVDEIPLTEPYIPARSVGLDLLVNVAQAFLGGRIERKNLKFANCRNHHPTRP